MFSVSCNDEATKKHRLSITKRYFGKINCGLMRLTPEKSAKASDEVIGSEYIIDLTAVAISCDDSRRRLIFKFKKESRDIGPVNKNEYDSFREMIQKHRHYRQSAYRNKKEDINELITANTYQSDVNTVIGRSTNTEQDIDIGKLHEDMRNNPIAELNERVIKIINDIKAITIEMKQMRKELKVSNYYERFRVEKYQLQEAKKISVQGTEEEPSSSDESEDKLEVAIGNSSPALIDAMQKQKGKIYSSEEILEKREEKPEDLIEIGELEKLQSRKHRDQLPKPSVAGEELGFRQLMAIVARRLPIPITFLNHLQHYRAISAYDPVDRIAYVTAFAVSNYSGMICRKQKPFNPLLGETFDYISNEGWKYHAEQGDKKGRDEKKFGLERSVNG
ncbi:hypothetical protein DINM_001554 [Dirofilaria immitis]|nr:hypothetical protein [Dirofilaria immitis]